jgi:hemolysin activation/secretion protein
MIDEKNLARIEQELTATFRNQGYILAQARVRQNASRSSGVLQIVVVEGYVDQVRFEGLLDSVKPIAAIANGFENGAPEPFHLSELERPLLILNDRAGVSARSYFRNVPDETAPGASTLYVRTERTDPVTGYVSFNNRGNLSSGPYQVDAGVQAHGLLGLGELARLRVIQTTQISELSYVRADTSVPIGRSGLRLNIGGSFSDGEPGAPILRLIDHESDGWSFQSGFSYPVIRSRSENLYVRLDADLRNSESDQLDALAIQDRLRMVRAGFDYDVADSLGGVNQLSFTLTKGIDGFGATANANPLASRFQGKTSFEKAEFYIARRQRISRNFELKLSASGQVANEILLSPEECGIGGLGFGRAYDSSEITGEDCIAGSAEVSWSLPTKSQTLKRASFYGFVEGGTVWNQGSFVADKQDSLVAAGIGLRFELPFDITGEVEGAVPLTRDVASEGNRSPRAFFRLTKSF